MESVAGSLKKSLESLKIYKKPMCLISNTDDGNLQLQEEALEEIKKVDMPLVIVAIAGLYRTGKSYLMNCLAGETQGFPIGYTTESKTKGIWAWCRIHPKRSDQVLLLLDTEGLGDIAKGNKEHENKIFTLAALLCNVLVYNMMSAFNQDAVDKLTFISEMSKNICFARGEWGKDDKFDLILPIFVLCLRDFILDIEKDGLEMTSDEYLEDCLELRAGEGMEIDNFNRPRECLRRYFPKRKCFTFDRPGSKSVMKRLETAKAEELSSDFRVETETFLNYVFGCKPKTLLSSKSMRGEMFVTLATSYISAINNGAILVVDDAIQMVAKAENERMANATVEDFKKNLHKVELPVLHLKDFQKFYEDIQNSSLAKFRSEAMSDTEVFEKRAIDEMEKLWKVVKRQNCELIANYCFTQMNQIYGKIIGTKRENGRYLVSGGYEQYRGDLDKVKRLYRKKMRDIGEYEVNQSLNEFVEREADYENELLMNDKKLSEEDRKREIENLVKENREAATRQQKLFEEKMDEERKRTEEHNNKMQSERDAYVKREEEKMQRLNEHWQQQKELGELQLQKMMTENETQRKEFREEIKQLKERNSKREEENMKQSERLLAEGRAFHKTQIDTIKSSFNDLFKKEQSKLEEYRNDMKNYQQSLSELLNKQAEENKQTEISMRRQIIKYEDERRRQEEHNRQQELKVKRKVEGFKAVITQGRIDADKGREENRQLNDEIHRLKNRNVWDRVWNN